MVKGKASPNGLDNSQAEASVIEEESPQSQLAHDVNDVNILRTDDILTEENVDFKSLLLPAFILNGLEAANFQKPSPIQLRSIPLLRLGFDLIVQSKAGTGKTLVIALAALETVKVDSKRMQVIVIAPTREIALQTKHFISIVSSDIKVRTEVFIGGTAVKADKKNTLGCQIAIGTPGRLNSLIESGDISLNHVRLFVLDEADKLMEKSIFSQIKSISKLLPANKQTILCSATFLNPVRDYVVKHMKEPFWVTPEKATRLQPGNIEQQKFASTALLGVTQFFKEVPNHPQIVRKLKYKLEEILDILSGHSFTQCMIFSNYQTRAETICHQLVANGWKAMSIRGQDEQTHRTATLNSFKELQSRVLLTTDVMSRGVDFRGVDLVINLDIPYDPATYLHRMGRAGRFGSYGCVITLASAGEEVDNFKKMLSEINESIVYVLPADLSLIKHVSKLEDVFFGSHKKCEGDLVSKLENLDLTVEDEGVSENLGPKIGEVCLNKRQSEDEKAAHEDVNIPVKCEGEKMSMGISKNPKGTKREEECKSNLKVPGGNTLSKECSKVSTCSLLSSSHATEASCALANSAPNLGKTVSETALQRATDQLSKALCAPKQKSLTLCTYEDMEKSFNEWSLSTKGSKIESSSSGNNNDFKDWWSSANLVLTAANLQLQELRENGLKKPSEFEAVQHDPEYTSSDESVYQPKKNIPKTQKKKSKGKTGGSSQTNMASKYQTLSTSPQDTPWLWDESSKLYYIWDELESCYYLYNPDLKCHFKWESGLNRYYKWDTVSQKYRLWDCETSCYCDTRNLNLNDANSFGYHSDMSFPRNQLDQNYISWFSMWSKQIRQMSLQVYQAEFLKNLMGQGHNL
ncbi:DEAD-box ATP-dependent RNA helicase CshA-like [Thrips palmi]|uniref:RNA helicase n=1 Tax=Thrips palmi TaxID=161013 RepID=A0A6P8ZHP2_THRPL|nr:DEAD-box ATP-dependent RNA helicase CshA-like [Thrips palmi]